MGLHIIIDGYNLIRQSSQLRSIDQQDIQFGREALLNRLAAYKKIKSHKITVVFDGIDIRNAESINNVKGIHILYSSKGEIADTVIRRMSTKEREKAVIVTSDREIIHFVESQGSTVIQSTDFEDKLIMAEYMNMKGTSAEEDDHQGWKKSTIKKGPSRRLAKKQRKDNKRLEKL
ncbi:MAG: NYN domain-containing protein [Desulfobacterales bacterium]|nr:NYN domain-containing protein [Desulfobacterales bacterium]